MTALSPSSSVLALIPHYGAEEWLGQAIQSLLCQRRPPDAIAVIDDGSPVPPGEIVEKFARVTLLASRRNVGPYALIQQVMDDTRYDAYMFQDADDWSAPDRLSRLLLEAQRTGAELLGTYEVRVRGVGEPKLRVCYPVDCNAALKKEPGAHVQLHPTTVVSAGLVNRSGGFATGLRYGADTEFVQRAHYIARVVNVPRYCYFRRDHPKSLTRSPDTGFGSRARCELIDRLQARARLNAQRVASGRPPDLNPLLTGSPIDLDHLLGPALGKRRDK